MHHLARIHVDSEVVSIYRGQSSRSLYAKPSLTVAKPRAALFSPTALGHISALAAVVRSSFRPAIASLSTKLHHIASTLFSARLLPQWPRRESNQIRMRDVCRSSRDRQVRSTSQRSRANGAPSWFPRENRVPYYQKMYQQKHDVPLAWRVSQQAVAELCRSSGQCAQDNLHSYMAATKACERTARTKWHMSSAQIPLWALRTGCNAW